MATYQVAPPVGGWLERNSYQAILVASQIADTAIGIDAPNGNLTPERPLRSFTPIFASGDDPAPESIETAGDEDEPLKNVVGVRARLLDPLQLNDAGLLAFAARGAAGDPIIAVWDGETFRHAKLPGEAHHLQLANDGTVLVQYRVGTGPAAPHEIRVYKNDLSDYADIASGDKFQIKARAGFSADGRIVAFAAIVKDETKAEELGVLVNHEALIVNVRQGAEWASAVIVGVRPDESSPYRPFTSYVDTRVAVTSHLDETERFDLAWDVGADVFYDLIVQNLMRAVFHKVLYQGESVRRFNPAAINVEEITPAHLQGDFDGLTRGEWLMQRYAPSTRDLIPTFDFLERGDAVANVNADSRFNNRLLLDLNNGYNPTNPDGMPHCEVTAGCRSLTDPSARPADPNPFAARTEATIIYGVDHASVRYVRELFGHEARGRVYPIDEDRDSRFVGDDEVWWRIDPPRGTTIPTVPLDERYLGDGTVPLTGSFGPFVKDDRVRTHLVAGDPAYTENNRTAILAGNSDTSHTGLANNVLVQKQVLAALGRPMPKEQIVEPMCKSTICAVPDLGSNRLTLLIDPVEAVVVDANGNRLGWTQETGPLQEIPGSIYFGDENGLGWVFGEVAGPLELRIRSLGGEHVVNVSLVEGEKTALVASDGALPEGSEKTLIVDADNPWHNDELPSDVNDDGDVTLADLIAVIAFARDHLDPVLPNGMLPIPPISPPPPPPYVDVTNDRLLTIADVLAVVLVLRDRLAAEGAEAEHEAALDPYPTAVSEALPDATADWSPLSSSLTCSVFHRPNALISRAGAKRWR